MQQIMYKICILESRARNLKNINKTYINGEVNPVNE